MAKIIFYKDPLNKNEKVEIEHKGTLRDILNVLDINGKPLSVSVNGATPDDIDLEAKLSDNDLIEIRVPVHGTKKDMATILSIAAIGSYFIPGVGPALAIGLGLAAGALMAQHAKDMAKDATSSERAIGLNAASPASASNEARPLQPIPVPIGTIRMAPDAYTDVITTRPMLPGPTFIPMPTGFSYQYNTWELTPVSEGYNYTSYPTHAYPFRLSYSTQTFCYGFGDLLIHQRRLGTIKLDAVPDIARWKKMNTWEFKFVTPGFFYGANSIISFGWMGDPTLVPRAPVSIKRIQDTQLYNEDQPQELIPPSDMSLRNWLIFEGNAGQDTFQFSIKGTLFNQSSSNALSFVQLQYKKDSDSEWREPKIKERVIDSIASGEVYCVFNFKPEDLDLGVDEFLQVRIRKVVQDRYDNEVGTSSTMSITDAFFCVSDEQNRKYNEDFGQTIFPMNIEGLYLANSVSDPNTNKKYSAEVETKCWFIQFDPINGFQWVWGLNRNPAWMFFYLARGGYKNLNSRAIDKSDTIPIPTGATLDETISNAIDVAPEYSPTDFWQNYKEAEGNEELVFGGGYKNDEIDIRKILIWSDFCNANNLTIGMIIRDDFSLAEALEKIAKVGRASVTYDTGKLSVVFEDKYQVPVTMFGMANILAGSFSATYASNIVVRKVIGKYTNSNNDYETETVEAIVPFSDPTSIEFQEVALDGVTDPEVAQKEINLLAARQFFQTRSYSWSTDQEGFLARRGDLVYLSHDSTQFGYSGRVVDFILNSTGEVIGIKGTSNIDSDVSWVIIRLPNSEMVKLRCHYDHDLILFDDPFPIQDAPYYIKDDLEDGKNQLSRFPNTYPDDYIFTADIKETVGKIVRISTVETDENHNFTYTAVDEDPAMWAFEQGVSIDPESIDDSIGVVEVYSCKVTYEGSGFVTLEFDASPDSYVMIVNEKTGQPIEINGRFSTLENKVRLELEEGLPTKLKLIPLRITERVQAKTLEVKLW